MQAVRTSAVALMAVAMAGCDLIPDASPGPAPVEPVMGVYAFDPCPAEAGGIEGVATIVLPNNYNDNRIARSVSLLKEKDPDLRALAPQPEGSKPNAGDVRNLPFDVFLGPDSGFGAGDTGLLLVRVVLLSGQELGPRWSFHRRYGFEGVGLANPGDAEILCGGAAVEHLSPTAPDQAREIASFHVRLDKVDWADEDSIAEFVIGIELSDYSDNPFFIDPKIRNGEGGGGIRPTPQG